MSHPSVGANDVAREHRAGLIITLVAALAIGCATLFPTTPSGLPSTPFCLICGERGGADVLQNILLFIPLGIGLGLQGVSVRYVILLSAVTTILVELLQLTVITGRSASLSDVLTNTCGGGIGWWLSLRWRRVVFPDRVAARRLSRFAAAGWLALMALGSWAMRPLSHGVAAGLWAPVEPHGARFGGSVLFAALAGIPVSNGPVSDPAAVQAAIDRGVVTVRVVFEHGAPTPDASAIVAVIDSQGRRVVELSEDIRDVSLSFHTAASFVRLRSPQVTLPKVVPESGVDTIVAVGGIDAGHLSLDVRAGNTGMAAAIDIGPALTWAMFYPFQYRDAQRVGFISILWALALAAPLGYWTTRTLPNHGAPYGQARRYAEIAGIIALPLVAMIAGYFAVPVLLRLATPPPRVLMGAATGLAAGVMAAVIGKERGPGGGGGEVGRSAAGVET